jgi:hypothetical protein
MNRTKEAVNYIKQCCRTIGAFSCFDTDQLLGFLKDVASDIYKANETKVFPGRYKNNVTYAIEMVASNEPFSPASAIGSEYLVNRFEYYFRVLSGKLEDNGEWINDKLRDDAKRDLWEKGLQKRISNLATTYRIMKTNQSLPIPKFYDELDKTLYPNTYKNAPEITNIGERIKYMRDNEAHGHWGDISSEGLFYGLLTTIIFYNQS